MIIWINRITKTYIVSMGDYVRMYVHTNTELWLFCEYWSLINKLISWIHSLKDGEHLKWSKIAVSYWQVDLQEQLSTSLPVPLVYKTWYNGLWRKLSWPTVATTWLAPLKTSHVYKILNSCDTWYSLPLRLHTLRYCICIYKSG